MKILIPNCPYYSIPRLAKEGKIKVGTRVKECEDPTKYPNVLDETLRTGTIGTVHGISSQKIDIIGLDEADIYFHENGFLDILEDEYEKPKQYGRSPFSQLVVNAPKPDIEKAEAIVKEVSQKPLSFSEPLTK